MPTLDEIRRQAPELQGLDDQQALNVLHEVYYADMDKAELGKRLGVKPAPKPEESAGSAVARGFKDAMQQVPETIGGTLGLVGDAIGADGLRDYGMGIYDKNAKAIEARANPNDSFTQVLENGGEGAGTFLAHGAGYVAGQAAQALVTGGAGGFLGSQLAKRGIREVVARGAESAMAKEVAGKVAAQGAKAGAGAALFGSNLVQEAGSIYPEAVQEAQKDERNGQLSGADLARVGLSAAAAAGVETAMDARMFHRISSGGRKVTLDPATGEYVQEGIGKALRREIPGGAAKEAVTEGIQTGIERVGAQQDLSTADAIRDYVDSMALGGLGGGLGGAAGALHSQKGPMERAATAGLDQKIALLTHDPQPFISFPDGSVGTKADFEQYIASFPPEQQLAERRRILGRDPDTGKRIEPEPKPEPTSADNDKNMQATIKAWSDRHDPVTLDYAKALIDAPGAKGMDLMIVPHGSGKGYTVLPSKWLTLDAQARYAALQKGDEAKLPGPDKEVPGGAIRVDSTGQAAPETYGEKARSTAAQRAIDEEAAAKKQKEIELGKQYEPGKSYPGVDRGLVLNSAGKPFMIKVAAINAQRKLGDAYEVIPHQGGFAVRKKAPEPRADLFDQAAHEAATSPTNDLPEPTPAQKEAGNYKKGHVLVHGLDISIENPAGSVRRGVDRDGKAWENTLEHHYGYIKGTVGADKDHIDAFIHGDGSSDRVFIVNQVHPDTGAFDEHKVIFGAQTLDEARKIYQANYAKDWQGGKDVQETDVEGFKAWLKEGDHKKPFVPQAGKEIGTATTEIPPPSPEAAPDKASTGAQNGKAIERHAPPAAQPASVKRPHRAGGAQLARNRLKESNPFLAFLAAHGVATEDRADTGGQPGRQGNRLVPGYGPIYRRNGKRLDELAALAHEAGHLTQDDIDSPEDNGGTRRLADMIERAVHRNEIITPAYDIDQNVRQHNDDALMAEAHRLGIDSQDKTLDEIYDAVVAKHADTLDGSLDELDALLNAGVPSSFEEGLRALDFSQEEIDREINRETAKNQAGEGSPADSGAISEGGPAASEEARGSQENASLTGIDNPTRLEQPRDAYTRDLFGAALPDTAGKPAAGAAEPERAGNLDADDAVPAGSRFASRTELVAERTRQLGIDQVNSVEDAAEALSYLGRGAVERLDALITDKNGKPLAIVGGFKGSLTQASVFPSTIAGEAFRIKGAANIWFAHNHPSGKPDLSTADKRLYDMLRNVFDGSQITPHGLFAIAGKVENVRDWEFTDGTDIRTGTAQSTDTSATVPVVEREYTQAGTMGPAISSPQTAKKLAIDIADGQAGIILLDVRLRPLAFVPIDAAAPLRKNGRMDAIYRAISIANGGQAMIVNNGKHSREQIRNLAGLLNSVDSRVIDVIDTSDGRVQSWSEHGMDFGGTLFGNIGPSFSPDISQADAFRREVDTTMNSLRSVVKPLTIGDTPAVLKALGAPAVRMTISRDVIRKATNGVKHHVSLDAIKALPEQLGNPVMVFESKTEKDSLVVLTELNDQNGAPVVAAIHLNRAVGNNIVVNDIRSVYGKEQAVGISGWVRQGLLRYQHTQKGPAWFTDRGLQLPRAQNQRGPDTKILTEADIVNDAKKQGVGDDALGNAALDVLGNDVDRRYFQQVADGVPTKDILATIAATSSEPLYRTMAQRFVDLGVLPPIEVGTLSDQKFEVQNREKMEFVAGYSPKRDKVLLFSARAVERNIIHELTHAATYKALRKGGLAARQMKALFNHVKSAGAMEAGLYGMENVDEFVAEAFSNSDFRYKLANVTAMPSGSMFKNAWQKFVAIVRRILGLPASMESALDQALRLGAELMNEEGKPGAPDEVRTQSGATQPVPTFSRDELGAGLDSIVRRLKNDADNTPDDNGPLLGNIAGDVNSFLGKLGVQERIRNNVSDLLASQKTFNSWWHKTIGTQYHKAQIDADFRRVYDAAQDYLSSVSSLANDAADLAPHLLPKLEGLADLTKKAVAKADAAAVGSAVFTGTLTDNKVYSDAELRSKFKLTDNQIKLYREFRAAVDKSLDDMAKTDMLRYLGSAGRLFTNRVMAATDATAAADFLAPMLERAGSNEAAGVIRDKAARVAQLKQEGYAPLMRFGEHTVYATNKKGDQLFFGMAESGRDAAALARDIRESLKDEHPDLIVTQGILSKEGAKLFSGISPDTIEVFASATGLDQNPLFQDYLKLVVNNRSALKRLIHRKGVAGFSQDTTRVLAQFLTSNSRASSRNLHMCEMMQAANDIPKEKGDVRDEAIRLVDYIQHPIEEAAKVRAFLFTNFIGGSIASAAVNMTQPVMMTLPYLAQFGGAGKATARLLAAMKTAATTKTDDIVDPELRRALQKGESEGAVSPQEIHNLQAEAMRNSRGVHWGDKEIISPIAMRKMALVWGGLFGLAEQFNRRATFIAAFQTVRGMSAERLQAAGVKNAYEFAIKAIAETQGVYNRGNRPNWARGALGATLMTFKQYSIAYIEFLKRLPPRERALALAILVVAAGANGLPFADDLDDVIDTIGQALGYNMNIKKTKERMVTAALGRTGAELVLHGFTGAGGLPLDVSMRMGMGNLLPATGLLRQDTQDKGREYAEVLGAAGGFAQKAVDATGKLLAGDPKAALMNVAGTAVANAARAADMLDTGAYRDGKGRKVIDTDVADAIAKAIGFQPADVAREQRALGMVQQDTNMAKRVKSDISDQWAEALFEKNQEGIAKARRSMQDWNEKNPQSRITIDQAAIASRVREMRMSKEERVIKNVPRSMRGAVREELQ